MGEGRWWDEADGGGHSGDEEEKQGREGWGGFEKAKISWAILKF